MLLFGFYWVLSAPLGPSHILRDRGTKSKKRRGKEKGKKNMNKFCVFERILYFEGKCLLDIFFLFIHLSFSFSFFFFLLSISFIVLLLVVSISVKDLIYHRVIEVKDNDCKYIVDSTKTFTGSSSASCSFCHHEYSWDWIH